MPALRILGIMMKSCSIALWLAGLAAGPVLAGGPALQPPHTPPADQVLGVVVTPAPTATGERAPRLRESLRKPVNVQPAMAEPYRMSDDERRKMREWLRNQAQETPLK